MEVIMERTQSWVGVYGGCCLFIWGYKLNNEIKKREEIMNWPSMAAVSSSDTTINQ